MKRDVVTFVIVYSLFLASCCVSPPVHTVHVAGYYNSGANDVAAYWRDDAAGVVPLYNTTAARGASVAVSGTDVYVAGFYTNSSPTPRQAAVYWKNGVMKPLHDTATGNAQAKAIAVSGSDVYVAGWVNEVTKSAVVWKIDAAETVDEVILWGANASEGLGVMVSGADVYVAGYYSPPGKMVSCWWKNDAGEKHDLYDLNFSQANGIAVSGSDVYVAGYYMPASTPTVCYWTWNGSTLNLEDLVASGEATSVYVSGSDVYIGGWYYNAQGNEAAAYWKNTTPYDLYSDTSTPGGHTAQAYSIAVYDGVVYAAGYVDEGVKAACYWEDGSRVDLYPSGASIAQSLLVD